MVGREDAAEELKDVACSIEHLHCTLGGAAGRFIQRRVGKLQQLLYARAVDEKQGNTFIKPPVKLGKDGKCCAMAIMGEWFRHWNKNCEVVSLNPSWR